MNSRFYCAALLLAGCSGSGTAAFSPSASRVIAPAATLVAAPPRLRLLNVTKQFAVTMTAGESTSCASVPYQPHTAPMLGSGKGRTLPPGTGLTVWLPAADRCFTQSGAYAAFVMGTGDGPADQCTFTVTATNISVTQQGTMMACSVKQRHGKRAQARIVVWMLQASAAKP